MAQGNWRRVRERNGSRIITIPSAFVAQMGLEDGTMMEIEMILPSTGDYILTMRVVEEDGDES